MNPLLFIN